MAEYRLLTIWRFDAPLEAVYAAIHNAPHWPDWWPGMQKVEEVAAGDTHGINSILRYFWQGRLPYRMVFEVRATRIEMQVAMEGAVQGDLEGIGRWHFSNEGAVSVVVGPRRRCDCHRGTHSEQTPAGTVNLLDGAARLALSTMHVNAMQHKLTSSKEA